MTVPFNQIPGNVRVPLFYAEMDNSAANTATENLRTLLIGQKLAGGAQPSGIAVPLGSIGSVRAQFGRGSMLAAMYERARQIDPLGEIWAVGIDDIAAGSAASGTIAIAGTASAAGALTIYIAGQQIQVAVAAAQAAAAVATALAAAINAAADLPVTAVANTGTVTLTMKWKGLTGNDVRVVENFRGAAAGEATPAGLTLTTQNRLTDGAGVPSLSAVITALGDEPFDFIVLPYSDTATLDALALEMNDSAGRWSYARQIYGHVYSALRGTLASLVSFGGARNDQHATIFGYEPEHLHAVWDMATAYGVRNAVFLKADPARPTQTGELNGVIPPATGKRFLMSERQTLLNSGIATAMVGGGAQRIERAITTYQKNAFNVADNSYLDSETLHTSAAVLRRLRGLVTSKYGRHKLADDGTRFAAGSPIVTPAVIRAELISEYARMEYEGLVENGALFAKYLVVERRAGEPNRLDVMLPPDYINQLRVFAVLNQFRLQYPLGA